MEAFAQLTPSQPPGEEHLVLPYASSEGLHTAATRWSSLHADSAHAPLSTELCLRGTTRREAPPRVPTWEPAVESGLPLTSHHAGCQRPLLAHVKTSGPVAHFGLRLFATTRLDEDADVVVIFVARPQVMRRWSDWALMTSVFAPPVSK